MWLAWTTRWRLTAGWKSALNCCATAVTSSSSASAPTVTVSEVVGSLLGVQRKYRLNPPAWAELVLRTASSSPFGTLPAR
jgi:hypothetical protein